MAVVFDAEIVDGGAARRCTRAYAEAHAALLEARDHLDEMQDRANQGDERRALMRLERAERRLEDLRRAGHAAEPPAPARSP